jgi:FkbM family methyltransferase
MTKLFYTLDKDGNEVLRDLEKENENFSRDGYLNGDFDANNYQWYENFHHFVYEDNGCDYERMGCFIKEGDSVLDIGANIGVFAHRAETRGAGKVVCFEPISPTFECLKKNIGNKTTAHKMAVGGESGFKNFKIHTDYRHIGGGTYDPHNTLSDKVIVYEEDVYMININDVFKNNHFDFMKIDIEGGEVDLIKEITDDNLLSLRCAAIELHSYEGFDEFQDSFITRMNSLGFTSFLLHHSNSGLRTVNFWKVI